MKVRFTKMQGAGNDFVVLDETRARLPLTPAHYRALADRHFGVGADQILTVRPAPHPGVDFAYVIHNADGGEVENCGNGARCFVRFVRERGLTSATTVRVQAANGALTLTENADGRVTVDMGAPTLAWAAVPFDATGLASQSVGQTALWHVLPDEPLAQVAVSSMGNPHATLHVDDVDTAPVATLGPRIQQSPAFPNGVNVGFMQVKSRGHIALRVYERGAGETLACGTGACAAVVNGIRLGWLDHHVDVDMRGGRLSIAWAGGAQDAVMMTGPAVTVFEGEIDLPDVL